MALTDLFDCCFGGCVNHYPEFNEIDTITFGLISSLLIIVYYKKRKGKVVNYCYQTNKVNPSLDILLQPKKETSTEFQYLPFSQFSLSTVYLLLAMIIFLVTSLSLLH